VKHLLFRAGNPGITPWALVLSLGLLSACGRNDIQVYRVAKAPEGAPAAALPQGHPNVSGGSTSPELKYKVPAGWQEVAPGEMRAASFRVAGQNGKQADVSVIPLPGMAGGDLDNVNRWRGQVGLKGVSAEDLAKLAQSVEIDRHAAQLYDQAGDNPGSGDKTRILAAILRREGTAWFFKMTGDDALVAQQKPTFVEFLKSVTFAPPGGQAGLPPSHPPIDGASELPPSHPPISGGSELPPSHPPIGGASMGAQSAPAASSGQDKPVWQVPSGWQEAPGGQFLVAKYLIKGSGDAQAAVNVSMSAGDGGGLLANLNRWRGQLGLKAVSEADLANQVQSLDVSGAKATLAEVSGTDPRTGQKSRLLAAIVPQGQQTWFYKLMGNEQVVEQQKEAFTKFVQTARYP
jgi:hypothetical protein